MAAGGAGELAAANGGWWHWFSRTAYSHRCADLSTVNTYAGLKMLAVKIMLAATLLGALGRWLIQRPASKNHACKVQGARPQSLRRNQRTANQPPLDQDGQWTTEHTSALCSSAVCSLHVYQFCILNMVWSSGRIYLYIYVYTYIIHLSIYTRCLKRANTMLAGSRPESHGRTEHRSTYQLSTVHVHMWQNCPKSVAS